MNICIVGNGESALNNKVGDFIDSCDHVIRFNHCITEGYEPWVGTKLDIYCSPYLWCLERGIRKVDYYKQFNWFWLRQKNNLVDKFSTPVTWFTPEQESKLADKIMYEEWSYDTMYDTTEISTGLVGVELAINIFANEKIFLTGFDGCQTGQYRDVKKSNDLIHEQLRTMNTSEDLPLWMHKTRRMRVRYHRMQNPYNLERVLLDEYINNGIITRIDV